MKQSEVFLPLLEQFCAATNEYKGKIDLPGLFLPHGLKNYDNAQNKYFYMGRDTNGWGSSFDELIEFNEKEELDKYIDNNNVWPTGDDFLEYTNNSAGGFWTLAARLHLKIKTGHSNYAIRPDLEDKYKELLQDMGWGNLNSIETQQSLDKHGEWDDIDQDIYWKIKSKSRIFDCLNHILDAFQPDYIFIFNWQADEEIAFNGLKYKWIKKDHIPDLLSIYRIEDYQTRIIWTIHPRNLSFKGMNIEELIELVVERM